MSDIMLYYVDGYHGGIRGHMPLGCWRDILEMLKKCPEWKLSIDVEPISWEFLKARDPMAYVELREMLKDETINSRLEMVSGSYAQPYGWITDGECNIRHLTVGLDLCKEHFPWMNIKTYAVQEPCWTSSLPQILKSLGFERGVLKDPSTAWGGYAAGFDAEVCLWEGPDGTQIPMVPRYACEELLNVWETESVNGEKDFAKKCLAHGIPNPTGMYYQDLGWRANPKMSNKPGHEGTFFPDYIKYTTWKEYFEQIADKPIVNWKVSQEVFQGALPWGERIMVRMARQVRRGEVAVMYTERLNALSNFLGYYSDFEQKLKEAWGHLLMTQHHDGWICAGAGKGEKNWAWVTSAQIWNVENHTGTIDRKSLSDIGKFACYVTEKDDTNEMLVVVNPLGRNEQCLVEAEVTSADGIYSFDVYDGDTKLISQYYSNRFYEDNSKNAGHLLFNANLPGYGVKAFKIKPSRKMDVKGFCSAKVDDDYAYLENDFFKITFDLMAGGTISSLYDKRRDIEVVDKTNERKFNEYRGYFINEAAWLSSSENVAEAEVLADGPVMAELLIRGSIGDSVFTQIVKVATENVRISVHVVFNFPEKTYIGEPHEILKEDALKDAHRSYHDGRYKLNAFFPTSFDQKYIYKDAAYDVCKSELENTYFKRWDEIKHNILIGWVDVSDASQGLTIMTDHTTSYIHGKDSPLGLTMAWGWDGGYWWGRRQLKGDHEIKYAIVPHKDTWRKADIWHEYQKMLYQTKAQRVVGVTANAQNFEMVKIDAPIEMSAAYLDGDNRLIVRLFNPGEAVCANVEIDTKVADLIELVELDGTLICCPAVERTCDKSIIKIHFSEFGIRTVRITRCIL